MAEPYYFTAFMDSPLGCIEITAVSEGISSVQFRELEQDFPHPSGLLADCIGQLGDYFSGTLKRFTIPLAPSGSSFQLRVWQELTKIPYGQIVTYSQLAIRLGGVNYTRIVGQANARNPIAILIPCHRVVGRHGALTGYAGGLWRKSFLLGLEQQGNSASFNLSLF